jgi:arylsulfatase A
MKPKNLILLLSVCTLALGHFSAFSQVKTNVVFILADDMGYGDLGVYGQKLIKTPNIDQLAANGIRFTQFYAGTSVCAPSRASLMTGLHTGHTPIRGNFEIKPEGQLPIPDSTFTLGELFKKAGYTTGVFGKWGLGYPGSEGVPNNQGFDQFYGYNCQRESHNFFPDHLWENTNRVNLRNTLTSQEQYAPAMIQEKAMAFLTNNRNQPFFLFLTYTLPHAGLQLPAGDQVFESYKKKFKETPETISKNWNGVGYQPQAYPKAAYAAMVIKLDQYVGEVVKKLKALGIEKNTLIVFTSDNGPHREGGNKPEFFNSSGGFRGIKRELYEGGIREPMIVNWPGKIKKNTVSSHIGAFWDFMPTFASLLQVAPQTNTDGISILPALLAKGTQEQHPYLYWEFHEDGGRQAVRLGNWKGVRLNVMKDRNAPIQLFDLAKDPKETTDLSAANPKLVNQISKMMKDAHTENKNFPF